MRVDTTINIDSVTHKTGNSITVAETYHDFYFNFMQKMSIRDFFDFEPKENVWNYKYSFNKDSRLVKAIQVREKYFQNNPHNKYALQVADSNINNSYKNIMLDSLLKRYASQNDKNLMDIFSENLEHDLNPYVSVKNALFASIKKEFSVNTFTDYFSFKEKPSTTLDFLGGNKGCLFIVRNTLNTLNENDFSNFLKETQRQTDHPEKALVNFEEQKMLCFYTLNP